MFQYFEASNALQIQVISYFDATRSGRRKKNEKSIGNLRIYGIRLNFVLENYGYGYGWSIDF